MNNYILPIEKLINSFQKLPNVGKKTAQRYAYRIIEMEKSDFDSFIEDLNNVKHNIRYCSRCGNFTDSDLCEICKNKSSNIVCVVKEPKDISSLEKVKNFDCVYHVLHGCISPMENRGPEDIRIKELLDRIKVEDIKEIIIATNPDIEGEATAMYIAKLIKPLGIKVTRLAQGISIGSDIEYADEITLTKAIESRVEI